MMSNLRKEQILVLQKHQTLIVKKEDLRILLKTKKTQSKTMIILHNNHLPMAKKY